MYLLQPGPFPTRPIFTLKVHAILSSEKEVPFQITKYKVQSTKYKVPYSTRLRYETNKRFTIFKTPKTPFGLISTTLVSDEQNVALLLFQCGRRSNFRNTGKKY